MSNATPTFLEKFFMMLVRWNAPVGGDPNQDFSPYDQPLAPVVNFLGGTVAYDAINNQIVVSLPGGGGGGGTDPIDFAIGTGGGVSVATIAAASKVWGVWVKVTTPFVGAGAVTLNLGQSGNATLLLAGKDLTVAGTFFFPVLVSWGGSTLVAVATVTGSPSAGAAEILIAQGPVVS